jgi:hypothetical protein
MAKQVKPKFVNPFDEGVTYADFLKSLPNGKTVRQHLRNKCTPEEIDWIESEIKTLKNK